MKINILIMLTIGLFIISACNKSDHTINSSVIVTPGEVSNFSTIGFEHIAETEIPFPVEQVFPLFEPSRRNLMYSWWDTTIELREAIGLALNGLITVSEVSGLDIFLMVTEHDTVNNHIQYLVLWNDFELQRIDITCSPGATPNSTKVVWLERNAGVHQNGVSLVTNYVTTGGIVSTLELYARNIEEYLEMEINGATITSTLTAQEQGAAINFSTIGFQQVVESEIPFPVEQVFPLFEPSGRNLMYDWWDPAMVLREASVGTLNNLVTVSQPSGHGSTTPVDVFLAVKEYDPINRSIQYIVMWGDFELQRIDITCVQGTTANSTKVIWTERNAGIHENGVSDVSDFVQNGQLVTTVEHYSKKIEEFLNN